MIPHKTSITVDPDVGDSIITLTVGGKSHEFHTFYPRRLYVAGTNENNWLRREVAKAERAARP